MNSKPLVSRAIAHFYNKASEETRLDKGMGIFEFERTKILIEKHINFLSGRIIDVGGGTGKYSAWLASKGHEVHLVEPVLKHVEIAKERAHASRHKFTVHQGIAQKLDFPDNFADLVILHGPLYHLQRKEERLKAIAEAKRVTKKGGVILGVAINRTAKTLVGLLQGLIHHKSFFQLCKEEISTGVHPFSDDYPWLLADAYYHKPDELRAEFEEIGLNFLTIYALEGMCWLDKNYFASLANPVRKATLMELLALTENDTYFLPFSPHMLIAVKK